MKLRVRKRERRCPLCHDDLGGVAEVHGCPGCGTAYHRECVEELRGCSTLGCRLRGEPLEVAQASTEARNSGLAPLLRHSAFSGLAGNAVKVELVTSLEAIFGGGFCLALLGLCVVVMAAFKSGAGALIIGVIPLAAAVVFGFLAHNTDCHYVVDFAARRLLYNRTFFGSRSLQPVADFDDVAGVAVDGEKRSSKSRSWWVFAIHVVLRSGSKVRVVDWDEDAQSMNEAARELAGQMGVAVYTGGVGQRLRITGAGETLRVQVGL